MSPHFRIVAFAVFATSAPLLGAQQAPPVLLAGVSVVNVMDGSVQSNLSVVIEGNRIHAIGDSATVIVPAGAFLVDARGKYLIPGLWDMHVHSAASVAWHFPLLVAHGITGVRNLHTTVDTALELTRFLKRRLASGELLGPRFLANGPLIDGEPSVWRAAVMVRTPDEARAAVDSLVKGGADFIKVYDNLPRDAYFAIADQAKRHGLAMVGHVPFRVRPEEAAGAGQRTAEHLIGMSFGCSTRADSLRVELERLAESAPSMAPPEALVRTFRIERALYDTRDPAKCATTVEAYRRSGMAVVPTLVVARNPNYPDAVLSDSASMRFIPPAVRRQWERLGGPGLGDVLRPLLQPTMALRLNNVRLLNEAGVSILAGTDLGNPLLIPGISLHQELTLLVEAGLTPFEALQTATLNPARVLGTVDSLGTIETGKIADLVLLDSNPLADIRNTRRIHAVIINGRYLDRGALDALLNAVIREQSANEQSAK